MEYRREIDGLRAIAVLSVVAYHFALPGFGGGFVGVDIFFVISGFLIGGILWREKRTSGRVSLLAFYARRIRRLAPAYFVMAAVTFLAAWAILLPFEFREFGKALIASTLYLSNVLFYRQSGYFDSAAADKALLHTWSLSVEEQFYIFLPLLFLLAGRFIGALKALLLALFAASLVAGIILTDISQTAAFYLFPFRAWELLAGVLLAILGFERRFTWAFGAVLSWAGLALVLGAVTFIEAGPGFPGWQAILPVLGAGLLILNGRHDNLINRALGARPVVFVGLISYSLYLWHWPVLVLSSYRLGGYSDYSDTALWLLVSFALAWASWRFVELPVRRMAALPKPALFGGAALASTLMLLAGGTLYRTDGLPARFAPDVRVHIDASADFLQDWSRCSIAATGPFVGLETCAIGPEGQPPEVLIWGDSHLRAFMDGLALAADEQGRAGLILWRAGCPPLFDLDKTENTTTRAEDADCSRANTRIRAALADGKSGFDTLLLIGRWSYYATGSGTGLDGENTIRLSAQPGSPYRQHAQDALFAEAALVSVREMAGSFARVFVLRQPPELPRYDSRIIARDMAHGRLSPGPELEEIMSVSRADLAARTATSEAPFRRLEAEGTIRFLDTWPTLCDDSQCRAVIKGKGYYFDNNHVTNRAAIALRHLFAPVLSRPTAIAEAALD
ncbi:MAG: acyltransferase [Rhodobacteraceae bacterium]|nr:acyltransferase [Paracoccaceae bacterium]